MKNPTPGYKNLIQEKKNITTKEKPKMETLRDYWDEEPINQVAELSKEYEDISLSTLLEM